MNFPARSLRTTLAVVVLLPLAVAVSAGAGTARNVRLEGSVVLWARAANLVRPARASEQITFQVYLGLRDAGAAERLAYDVSDPASPSYRPSHWSLVC